MSKEVKTLLVLIGFALAVFAAGLRLGFENIPFNTFFDSAGSLNYIVRLRAMRLCAAFTVGGSLALSGLIFQSVLRNVLAEPFTLGVSGGASIGAVTAYITGVSSLSILAVPVCAFAGGIIVLAAVLVISSFGRRGATSLLLSGVIASTICGSILMYLISMARVETLASVTYWMLGDLDAPDTGILLFCFCVLLASSVFTRVRANVLDAVSLGREQAFYLGVNPCRTVLIFVFTASVLAASSVALAGIISFCGLIVPHIVHRMAGASHRGNVLACVLAGGVFLMICDTAARAVSSAREMPVGVASAVIGGVFFLYLLNRGRVLQ